MRKHYIVIGNQHYGYTLHPMRTSTTLVCKSANIEDRFPNDEIPRILARLPQIIREQYGLVEGAPQTEMLRFRVTEKEKNEIEHTAREMGYASVSAYLRDVALQNGPERALDQ